MGQFYCIACHALSEKERESEQLYCRLQTKPMNQSHEAIGSSLRQRSRKSMSDQSQVLRHASLLTRKGCATKSVALSAQVAQAKAAESFR